MSEEGIALREDRLTDQRRTLADNKQPNSVFAALQRDLADATNHPLCFTVKARAKRRWNNCVSFLKYHHDAACLAGSFRPIHDRRQVQLRKPERRLRVCNLRKLTHRDVIIASDKRLHLTFY